MNHGVRITFLSFLIVFSIFSFGFFGPDAAACAQSDVAQSQPAETHAGLVPPRIFSVGQPIAPPTGLEIEPRRASTLLNQRAATPAFYSFVDVTDLERPDALGRPRARLNVPRSSAMASAIPQVHSLSPRQKAALVALAREKAENGEPEAWDVSAQIEAARARGEETAPADLIEMERKWQERQEMLKSLQANPSDFDDTLRRTPPSYIDAEADDRFDQMRKEARQSALARVRQKEEAERLARESNRPVPGLVARPPGLMGRNNLRQNGFIRSQRQPGTSGFSPSVRAREGSSGSFNRNNRTGGSGIRIQYESSRTASSATAPSHRNPYDSTSRSNSSRPSLIEARTRLNTNRETGAKLSDKFDRKKRDGFKDFGQDQFKFRRRF